LNRSKKSIKSQTLFGLFSSVKNARRVEKGHQLQIWPQKAKLATPLKTCAYIG